MRSFHVRNFGCRASQADGAAIAGQLSALGMQEHGENQAELVVLNSCTVTAAADQDLKKAVRRAHRENPGARILVTGCYAQRDPAAIAALPGVTWVAGNSHKDKIGEIIESDSFHSQIRVSDIFERQSFFSAPIEDATTDRSRPNLKIQDGCNNRCSFCIIPSVRGASRSAEGDWVVDQVRGLSQRYAEIVLTGVNLGRWGRENGAGRQLAQLIRRLLRETDIRRLRLSSIEPMDWTPDLIELMAGEPRIARHVHAPLQSGSDTVLRRMYRKYRPRHYRDRILQAAQAMPDAAFGADVMTGFPGETEAEFAETIAFILELPFTYLHVFTYSERPGTRAAELSQVPREIRKQRTAILRELSAAKNLEFRRRFLGAPLSVVTLGADQGISGNFIAVTLAAGAPAQQIRDVPVRGLTPTGLAEMPDILP